MTLRKTIKRELEVAFSKHSQPVWFRILKYILLGGIIFFFWGTRLLWIILLIMFAFALLLHFWYRYKTHGWTKSYGLWKHEKDRAWEKTSQPCFVSESKRPVVVGRLTNNKTHLCFLHIRLGKKYLNLHSLTFNLALWNGFQSLY